MDRGRAFAPPPGDGVGRHGWRDHGPPYRGDSDREWESERGRGGHHFDGWRRESDYCGNRNEGGHFYHRGEGGHSYGRRGGVGGHIDGRRESDQAGGRRDRGQFVGRREAEHSSGGRGNFDAGNEGGHTDGRREADHFDGRREGGYYGRRGGDYLGRSREGGLYDGRKGGGLSDGRRKGGHFDGNREDDNLKGKPDQGERHSDPPSDMGSREGKFVQSRVWGKSRKPDPPREGWGASVRLSNIPDGVTIPRLRRILKEKGVHGGFDIKHVRKGSSVVSFVEDSQRIVDMLGEIKIDNCQLHIEVVQNEPEKCSGETKASVEIKGSEENLSRVPDQKKLGSDFYQENLSVEGTDSGEKKRSQVSSKKKRKADLNKKKLSPDSNKKNVSLDSGKVPQTVKDAEAVFKEAIGLLIPDSYEVRDGKIILVYSMGMDILEDFKKKLDKVLERGSGEVLIEPVKIAPVQEETSKNEKSKVTDENSQEKLTIVATSGGEIDHKVIDDQCEDKEEKVGEKSKEEVIVEPLQQVSEKVGEEATIKEIESEPLQQVEAVFASMDVREKQKVIEQAKQKSLGDFLITAKPKQGQMKKKKKRKPANAEHSLEDEAQKARTAGY